MTDDFEKATRSHARSQARHKKYIMRELRSLAESLKIQVWEFLFRKVRKLNYEISSPQLFLKDFAHL